MRVVSVSFLPLEMLQKRVEDLAPSLYAILIGGVSGDDPV
jgi:hypothetical protein